MRKLGLYLHIPFCKSKCLYCDFPSYAGREDWMERVVEGMCAELRLRAEGLEDAEIQTVYIGGGTPSILPPALFARLLRCAGSVFSFAGNAEISCEMNPGTVTGKFAQTCVRAGVNRVSMGAQASQERLLRALGRIHTFDQVRQSVSILREAGIRNLNLDMMLGLPGQTLQDARETLDAFLSLRPEHISCYALIVEEGTPLEAMVESGRAVLPDEDTEREMYEQARAALEARGYHQYEISNFAREGFLCRHNRDCWLRREYVGIGPAACGFLGNTRYRNPAGLEAYLRGDAPEITVLTEEDARFEAVMLGLRLTDGVSEAAFQQAHGMTFRESFGEKLDGPVRDGRLTLENGVMKLTRRGMDVMNSVLVELM